MNSLTTRVNRLNVSAQASPRRDADTGAVYVFDKDAIASTAGVTAGDWGQVRRWREETSGVTEGSTVPPWAPGTHGLDAFCLSCHDADGATTAPMRELPWRLREELHDGRVHRYGAIHGTSGKLWSGVGKTIAPNPALNCDTQAENALTCRRIYRFMNGASMRFFDPNGWSNADATCITLGADDGMIGGCTAHSGGATKTKFLVRSLAY